MFSYKPVTEDRQQQRLRLTLKGLVVACDSWYNCATVISRVCTNIAVTWWLWFSSICSNTLVSHLQRSNKNLFC